MGRPRPGPSPRSRHGRRPSYDAGELAHLPLCFDFVTSELPSRSAGIAAVLTLSSARSPEAGSTTKRSSPLHNAQELAPPPQPPRVPGSTPQGWLYHPHRLVSCTTPSAVSGPRRLSSHVSRSSTPNPSISSPLNPRHPAPPHSRLSASYSLPRQPSWRLSPDRRQSRSLARPRKAPPSPNSGRPGVAAPFPALARCASSGAEWRPLVPIVNSLPIAGACICSKTLHGAICYMLRVPQHQG